MYSVTAESTDRLVQLRLSGKVSGKEYAAICALLHDTLARNQNLDLLCELDGVRGIGLTAIWRAARIATQNETNLRRVAVVGDRQHYKWARVLVRGFHAETRYFPPAQRMQATRWLRQTATHATSASNAGLFGDASYRPATVKQPKQKKKQRKSAK